MAPPREASGSFLGAQQVWLCFSKGRFRSTWVLLQKVCPWDSVEDTPDSHYGGWGLEQVYLVSFQGILRCANLRATVARRQEEVRTEGLTSTSRQHPLFPDFLI